MSTPAGWYDDPDSAAGMRYWDGSAWTDNRAAKAPGPGSLGGPPARSSGLAIAAFVLGIVSLLGFPILAPFIGMGLAVMAVALGGFAMVQIRNGLAGGKAFALVGLILGAIVLVLSVVGLIIRLIGWLG